MDPLHLSEGGSPRGEGHGADPPVLFVQRGVLTAEDGLVVARGPEEDGGGLLKKLSPAFQKFLDVLQKNTTTGLYRGNLVMLWVHFLSPFCHLYGHSP